MNKLLKKIVNGEFINVIYNDDIYLLVDEFVCENVTLGLSILENDAVIMIDDIDIPTVYTEWNLSTLSSPRNLANTP